MGNNVNRRGFTLIELIVVIAIVGILVLLAVSSLGDYISKARLTHIIHDIKVAEDKVGELLINEGDLPGDWEDTERSCLEAAKDNRILYEKQGIALTIDDGEYKSIDGNYVKKSIRSRLRGKFYTNQQGKVYYEDTKVISDKIENDDDNDEGTTGDLVNQGWIPVASAAELQQINDYEFQYGTGVIYKELTWGAGTEWQGEYTGKLDSSYVIVNDIDFSGYNEDWIPIGKEYARPFQGTITGLSNKLKNFNMDDTLSWNEGSNYYETAGIFGIVGGNAEFTDIKIEEPRINIDVDEIDINGGMLGANMNIGVLIGQIYNGNIKIKNINITNADIKCIGYKNVLNKVGVGGLVGYDKGENTTIEDVIFGGNILGHLSEEINNDKMVGGIVGSTCKNDEYTLNMKNVSVSGNIVGSNTEYFNQEASTNGGSVGGLIGLSQKGYVDIEDININAEIKGNVSVGGIIGQAEWYNAVTIKNPSVKGNITGFIVYEYEDIKESKGLGGIIGTSRSGYAYILDGGIKITGGSVDVGSIEGDDRVGGIIGFSSTTFFGDDDEEEELEDEGMSISKLKVMDTSVNGNLKSYKSDVNAIIGLNHTIVKLNNVNVDVTIQESEEDDKVVTELYNNIEWIGDKPGF